MFALKVFRSLVPQGARTLSEVAAPALVPKFQQVVRYRDETVFIKQMTKNNLTLSKVKPEDVSGNSGFPRTLQAERVARIAIPSRNVMQSGVDTQNQWCITFDTQERWENPLMGWG